MEYHQFTVACDNDSVEWDGSSDNGLVAMGHTGGAVLVTSIATGHVRYTAAIHDASPPVDLSWDDIAEVTLRTATGEIYIEGFANLSRDETNLADHGPGDYRLRVCARSREEEWDYSVEVAREEFRFDIWPAPIGACNEKVLKVSFFNDRFRAA